MRKAVALLGAFALSGCGVWTSTIRTEVVDYGNVLEQTADKFLLVNVLEARDDAPLHFSAMPNVHGSLQATASLSGSLPFAEGIEGRRVAPVPAMGSTPATAGSPAAAFLNGSITPTISVQSQPTFEVDLVDSKDFVTGISTPIDPKFIKYWVDRGVDRRVLLSVYFSSATIVDTAFPSCDKHACHATTAAIVVHNNPRAAADQLRACVTTEVASDETHCHGRTDFQLYLTLINKLQGPLTANVYTQRTLVAHDQAIDAKDAGGIDPAKYQLEREADGKFDLYTVPAAPSYALCLDGRLDLLSGWNASLVPPLPLAASHVVADKKGHTKTVKESAMPSRGDVCADAVVNAFPFGPPVVPSLKASTFIVPLKLHVDTEKACGGDARNQEYCKIFKDFTDVHDESCEGCIDHRFHVYLTPRSVAEMIRFLGDILYYQREIRPIAKYLHNNDPVTLHYDKACHDENAAAPDETQSCLAKDEGLLFNVQEGGTEGRVTVQYRGVDYAIAEHTPLDHSLEVLSIINQLVNLNHSAADIRPTPIVQVIP